MPCFTAEQGIMGELEKKNKTKLSCDLEKKKYTELRTFDSSQGKSSHLIVLYINIYSG